MFVELMGVVISYNHAHLPTWSMVLYMVGLGLCDASDITVKGLEVVRRASRVYLEAYTSILTVGREELVSNDILSAIYWSSVMGLCLE